jgi:membrane associated rhomboid family serine protease
MIVPIRTDSPLRTMPWMNWAIILANIVVFMVQQRHPSLDQVLVLSPRDPHLAGYLSYAFLHAHLPHLVGNMLFLFLFGNNVNDRLGSIGYLAFYLSGAVFAGIGHVLTQDSAVVGASGAVAAVTGAYLALFPRSNITLVYWLILVAGTVEVPSMWFIAFFFLKDLVLNVADIQSGVSHAAHLSGTLWGLGLCMAMLSVTLLPRDQFDVLALIQRWNRRRQYRELVRGGYDPFAYAGPAPAKPVDLLPPPPDPKLQQIQDLRAEISEAIAHHNHPHAALLFLELKRIDSRQVLSRQAQLDVANQLASQQLYREAADAYEQFLSHYSSFEQIEQVELMLGLIYARYLDRYERAREFLIRAQARLHSDRELEMARTELARIAVLTAGRPAKTPTEPD